MAKNKFLLSVYCTKIVSNQLNTNFTRKDKAKKGENPGVLN